jgi:predicted DNA-binding transcriptional regulator AlpA
MVRKNLKLSKISQNLVDANYIAGFLGISLNALYLRMHFENFPKALKINGKLYFELNEVLAHFAKLTEDEAFCFLVRDEVRSLIEVARLSRREVGEVLGATNPSVAGGGVYSRPIGLERAQKLMTFLKNQRFQLDIDETKSFTLQKKERIAYINEVWEYIISLVDSKKIDFSFLALSLSQQNDCGVGRSIYKLSPSYKSAKLIKLRLLQKELI